MMHMTLYWGIKVTLLFDSWRTDSWPSYLLSLLACFLFSSFYQYMEDRRIKFKSLSLKSASVASRGVGVPLLGSSSSSSSSSKLVPFTWPKFAGAFLFGFNSAIGYLLMLAIMSFNGGVFLAIVAGLSVGYFFFRNQDDEVVVVDDNPCACA